MRRSDAAGLMMAWMLCTKVWRAFDLLAREEARLGLVESSESGVKSGLEPRGQHTPLQY